jgi:elongation factor P
MKQQANLIRAGQVIEHEGRRWTVLKQQIITPGKGGAFIQVEMRDLKTGNKTNERWRTADTVERLLTDNKDYIYSYTDGDNLVLMDKETYEQAMVPSELLGDGVAFLQDNMPVTVDLVEGDPVGIHLPVSVVLEIVGPDGHQLLQAGEALQRRQDDGAALHRDGGAHRGPHRGWILHGAGEVLTGTPPPWHRAFPHI